MKHLLALLLAVTPAFATTYYVDGSQPSGTGGTTTGTTQADADSTTTTLVLASTASATNNAYLNYGVLLTSGGDAGKSRKITAYDGTTKVCTLASQFSATEANIEGVTYIIVKGASSNTGLSATPGTTTTGPFATIQDAVATASGAAHTISVAYAIYSTRNAGYSAFIDSSTSGHDLTFVCTGGNGSRCQINDDVSSNRAIYARAAGGAKLTFNGFDINSDSATTVIESTTTQSVRLINCVVTNGTNSGSHYAIVFNATGGATRNFSMEGGSCYGYSNCGYFPDDCGSIGFEGVEFDSANGATTAVAVANDITSVLIDDCTIGSTLAAAATSALLFDDNSGVGLGAPTITSYGTRLRISNNTLSIPRLTRSTGRWYNFEIVGNTLTLLDDHAILLGLETDGAPATTNSYPFGRILIADNTLTYSATDANHNLFLGIGAGYAQVVNNTITAASSTGDGHIVVKSDYNFFANNVIHSDCGYAAVYIPGGKNNVFVRNTIVSTDATGGAVLIDWNQDETDPLYNTFYQNILYGPFAISIDPANDSTAADWHQVFDRNVYYATGTNVANFSGTTVAYSGGAAALRTAWATYVGDNAGRKNDAHTVLADPQFVNTTTRDYRVRQTSSAVTLAAGAAAIDHTTAVGGSGLHYTGND